MDKWLKAKITPSTSNPSKGYQVLAQTVSTARRGSTDEESVNSDEIEDMDDSIFEVEEEDVEDINTTPKRKSKTIKRQRVNKFCVSWLQIAKFQKWLEKSKNTYKGNELAHCSVCSVDIASHKSAILRHYSSKKHTANYRVISNNNKITEVIRTPLQKKIEFAELKLAGLLATNNLPFSLMDTLSPLCAHIFNDSEIAKNVSVKRTKATHLVKNSLGHTFSQQLYATLREAGCFFSIIMDETTDVSVKKQCAYAVVYFSNKTNRTVTKFFDMIETNSGTAIELYQCLKNSITSKEISFNNLIGFSADTTNVMVGQHNSIFSNLKNDKPEIVCVKCSCHMIHLAASRACLELPRSVEDLLRNIGSHFSRSSMRQGTFREFQEFFKTEIHKILSPASTRWLSLKQCVDRVIEQFLPLKEYLRHLVFEDPSKTTEEMQRTMDNKFTLLYLEFMSYTLGLLTEFNLLFQTEAPLLYKLKTETKKLLNNLCSNFIDISVLRSAGLNIFQFNHTNPRNFVPLDKIYLGIQATNSFNILKNDHEIPKTDLDMFLKTCLKYYLELITDVKKRFDFSDSIYDIISVLDPRVAQSFEVKSLAHILERLPSLKDYVDQQALDQEWKDHALLEYDTYKLNSHLDDAEKYWSAVFSLKNVGGVTIFKNLKKVMSALLILPFSNVCVERIFSDLKNIKTEHRNKLDTETIRGILFTKQGVKEEGGIVKFVPTIEMHTSKIWNKKL